jgi:colanic acid biosynthesis glycosyl transferase WcaI
MSRILIWSPNYAPEYMGIPPLVTDAAEWLTTRDHHVDVVTAMPSYPARIIHPEYRGRLWMHERRQGVSIHRSWLRVRPQERVRDKALYELSFAVCSLPLVLRRMRQADIVICVVPSLFAAAFAAAARRFVSPRTRLVLWVQDLVLAAATSIDPNAPSSRLMNVVREIERRALLAADDLVVCSPGFRDYLLERGVDDDRIATVLNWVDPDEYAVEPRSAERRPTHFLYAGNIGYTQGLETAVEAARLAGSDVRVSIVGEGNAAESVRRSADGAANVEVRPAVRREDAPGLLATADAHLVIQRRVSANVNFPSKIATCLASGRPVLASLDERTPAARVLRESGGAIFAEPEDASALAEGMLQLHASADLRASLGAAGRSYATSRLSREILLPELERAFLA